VVGGSNPLAPTNKTNQLASATVLILVNCIVFCIVGFGCTVLSNTSTAFCLWLGDKVIEGEIEKEKIYTEAEMNCVIEIQDREKYRVEQ
jgi:hypothetical protein